MEGNFPQKVVIAGGTGFIGQYLDRAFTDRGWKVKLISRKGAAGPDDISWSDLAGIQQALENASLLINLAGKSVDCRYNKRNKAAILHSRTSTTRVLGEAIEKCANPPGLWINSSTATIYRHAEDRPMTEAEGEIGSGFSVNVARSWEKRFFDFKPAKTRQVALRMAIVLGNGGGALVPLRRLVQFGLGGKQGNGRQMFSWIHIEDLYRVILFCLEEEALSGVLNCSAPSPVSNAGFMRELRRQLRVPFGLPSPAFLLTIGAFFIRTETELILKSRWVIPDRLSSSGFSFRFPDLHSALTDLFKPGGDN
jgi:uncharacterized protein (TIGR01777 family)